MSALYSAVRMEIVYDYPLYRPPSEADSTIFQVTLGCSFNKCSFCNMYRTKEYQERPWEEIKAEIDLASNAFPQANRVFLGDGDALNLPTDRLIHIIGYLCSKFPALKRVASYAMPKNILQKNDEDMDRLRHAGLGMLYLGIETGNDILLKKGIYAEFLGKFGEPFIPLEDTEILDELGRLIAQIKPQRPIIFRANHASNVYSIGGTLPNDKAKLLSLLEDLKRSPGLLKPKVLRRF